MFIERAEVDGKRIAWDTNYSTTNRKRYDVRSNPGHRSGKTATNSLSFKTALAFLD
jgi:hypothetical protein